MQMAVFSLRRVAVFGAVSVRRHAARVAGVEGGVVRSVSTMGEKGQKQRRQFWLLKTEPDCWSWQNQEENKGLSVWDGVRNGQAQKLMKSMSVDDLCLFYHTGKLREVAGVVRVVKTFYPDPTDDTGKWGAVDVQEVEEFKQPVTLAQMKDDEHFKGFLMLRQPRLSVVPVDESIWDRLCDLGGVNLAESLNAKKTGKKGNSIKTDWKVEAEKTENGIPGKGSKAEKTLDGNPAKGAKAENTLNANPAKGARASNRNSTKPKIEAQTVETTENGHAEKKQAKAGARKRGAKEVVEEPKKHSKSETEEAPTTRAPKTRKKKAS